MPMYYKLRDKMLPLYYSSRDKGTLDRDSKVRVIGQIEKLRKHLSAEIPKKTARETFLLATWNIRDFGGNRLNPSPRTVESIFYMAEIISAFDLVALQEVNKNMSEFNRLMEILGPSWKYIATDVTDGSGGNKERMAFVYDTAKVYFQNIAGEIVLDKKNRVGDEDQFARTPFLVKFQIGWLKVNLCTVHLYYGDSSGEGYERRVKEIDKIGEVLKERSEDKSENENYVLLGDMNIVKLTDKTFLALKKHGFVVPEELAKKNLPASNMNQDKFYDQIAFLNHKNVFEIGSSANNAGVFNYYKSVFTPEDSAYFHSIATNPDKWGDTDAKRKKYFEKEWRTWQMSDHLPMWIELKIDFTEKYLEGLKETL